MVLRVVLRLSPKALAAAAGLPDRSLQGYERGDKSFSKPPSPAAGAAAPGPEAAREARLAAAVSFAGQWF